MKSLVEILCDTLIAQCNAIHIMPLTISLSSRPATGVNGINQHKSNFTESELIDCMLTNDALLSTDKWLCSINVLFSIFFALHLSISSSRPIRAHFNQFTYVQLFQNYFESISFWIWFCRRVFFFSLLSLCLSLVSCTEHYLFICTKACVNTQWSNRKKVTAMRRSIG